MRRGWWCFDDYDDDDNDEDHDDDKIRVVIRTMVRVIRLSIMFYFENIMNCHSLQKFQSNYPLIRKMYILN